MIYVHCLTQEDQLVILLQNIRPAVKLHQQQIASCMLIILVFFLVSSIGQNLIKADNVIKSLTTKRGRFSNRTFAARWNFFSGSWWCFNTNLWSCPVNPAFSTWVNVDQNQSLHEGGVVQLGKTGCMSGTKTIRCLHQWVVVGFSFREINSFFNGSVGPGIWMGRVIMQLHLPRFVSFCPYVRCSFDSIFTEQTHRWSIVKTGETEISVCLN